MSEQTTIKHVDPVDFNSIGDAQALKSFTPEGLARMSEEERRTEGLGIALAQWAQWNGLLLLQVFHAALEDANYHAMAAKVDEWIAEVRR